MVMLTEIRTEQLRGVLCKGEFMKKAFFYLEIIVYLFFVFAFLVPFIFADEARIKDLILQNQQIDQEIAKRQKEIEQLTVMRIENNGRIKELQEIEQKKQQEAQLKKEQDEKTNTVDSVASDSK